MPGHLNLAGTTLRSAQPDFIRRIDDADVTTGMSLLRGIQATARAE